MTPQRRCPPFVRAGHILLQNDERESVQTDRAGDGQRKAERQPQKDRDRGKKAHLSHLPCLSYKSPVYARHIPSAAAPQTRVNKTDTATSIPAQQRTLPQPQPWDTQQKLDRLKTKTDRAKTEDMDATKLKPNQTTRWTMKVSCKVGLGCVGGQ